MVVILTALAKLQNKITESHKRTHYPATIHMVIVHIEVNVVNLFNVKDFFS